MYMKVTFPEAITISMEIGYDFLVFKYPVTWKQNFQILIISFEINKTFFFYLITT